MTFMEDDRAHEGRTWLVALGAMHHERNVFSYGNVWWAWDADAKIPNDRWLSGGWRCYYTSVDTDVGESPEVHPHPLDALNAAYKNIEARMAAAPNALMELLHIASTPITLPVIDVMPITSVVFPIILNRGNTQVGISQLTPSEGVGVPRGGNTKPGDSSNG